MSSLPASSVPDPRTQTFPALTDKQIQRIESEGTVRHFNAGTVLFQPDDVNLPFYVMLSGRMEISQKDVNGVERAIAKHDERGQFTGEMTMITGQRCLVTGRMTEPGDLIEIKPEALRYIIARDAELSEVLLRAFILRRIELVKHGFGNVIVLGSRHSARTLEIREFLSRNAYPYTYIDLDTDSASQELLDRFDVKPSEVPVVVCNGVQVLKGPTIQEVASCLGFNVNIDSGHARDLIIIGAGPAGLAGAVYAASEGLDVLVVETRAPGGQAGSSSKIENYLGFPTGISGFELAARATTQAQKFGADMMIARCVAELDCGHQPYRVRLDGGDCLRARAVMIATGAQYRKLNVPKLELFEGKGVYYGATYIESQLCGNEEVAVVGGGNSAGQAAVFLSQTAPMVYMLVRSSELRSTMSRYLTQRLTENPRIQLFFDTEVTALEGDGWLESVTWTNKRSGEQTTHNVKHLFTMTGASPRTDWLQGCLAMDRKGFILTGRDLEQATPDEPHWPLDRQPLMLETSLPGVFAVGDARAGNVKRVASAVGEGAIAVHMVHRVLAEL